MENPAHSCDAISPRDLIIIISVIIIWGFNFVPMIYALNDLTPIQLGAGRFLLASLPFLVFVSRPLFPLRWLFLYAATQGFGQFMLLFIALNIGMSAAVASLLMQVQVFYTALLGVLLLGESLSRALKIGLMVSGVGLSCFIVSVLGAGATEAVTVVGLGLTLTASMMWAISNIVIKKIHQSGYSHDPLSTVVWAGLISGLMFLVTSLSVEGNPIQQNWQEASLRTWLSLLYLGVAANGIGYWVWARMLTRYPASRVAPFSLGVPVVGMIAGVVVLDETVSALEWVGAALIMSALVFVVAESRRAAKLVVTPKA